jgi:hypothetical protein
MFIRVRMAQLAFSILLFGGSFGGAGAPADWKSEAVPFLSRRQGNSKSAQTPTWSEGHKMGLSGAGLLKQRPEPFIFIVSVIQM